MPDVLVVQNTKNEGIGTLGKMLERDGFGLETVLARSEPIPKSESSVIVLLGAPQSANDDLDYLKQEMEMIREAVRRETPVLGICLGSQLIAKGFGARVYQGKRKEIGFYSYIEFDNISQSQVFQGLQSAATVFHWHGDTFELPTGAVRLAHSRQYENQAIKIGSAVGEQLHMQVDDPTIRLWHEKSKDEVKSDPYIRADEIIKIIPEKMKTVQDYMEIFYRNFNSEFGL